MRFASLGSGSRGNSTLVECGDTLLMIDNGFSTKETDKRLEKLAVSGHDIDAILVTHEHSDHVAGVARYSRRYDIPVWASHGTSAMIKKLDGVQCFNSHQTFNLGAFEIEPFDIATVKIAQYVAEKTKSSEIISVAGGGDTVSAMAHAGVKNDLTYLSSAGGAFLEWLEGKELPGVKALSS